MKQAIRTKYHGPTDRRGSRVTATAPDGRKLTMALDSSADPEVTHRRAAEALAAKLAWPGRLTGGELNDSYVWTWTPAAPPITQLEFLEADFPDAEHIARRLGYTQTAYTSTSGLWGLFCLRDRPRQKAGCIIKTSEFGFIFVQDKEDLNLA